MALDGALQMLQEEGLQNIFDRHTKNAQILREGLKEMGMKLFVEDEKIASRAITAVYPPEGVTVPEIRKTMKEDYSIVVANGQNDLKDKIFRMGTLGFVCERDVLTALASLKATVKKLAK